MRIFELTEVSWYQDKRLQPQKLMCKKPKRAIPRPPKRVICKRPTRIMSKYKTLFTKRADKNTWLAGK